MLRAPEITTLRQQVNGHRTAIKQQKKRFEDLRQQPLQATASSHAESTVRLQIAFSWSSPKQALTSKWKVVFP
jgi:ATP/maltotriose-dependent transcriptional regulator MalT